MTREESISKGAKHYDPVKPCKHGHLSKRRVTDYGCMECSRVAQSKLWQAYYETQFYRERCQARPYKKRRERHGNKEIGAE